MNEWIWRGREGGRERQTDRNKEKGRERGKKKTLYIIVLRAEVSWFEKRKRKPWKKKKCKIKETTLSKYNIN